MVSSKDGDKAVPPPGNKETPKDKVGLVVHVQAIPC